MTGSQHPYEQTSLWRGAEQKGKQQNAKGWYKLAVAYDKLWRRSTEVAQGIAHDVPGLTLHDEKHFTAVWERAEQIAGIDYNISPLEVFALGVAICLHDLAHTISVYKEGITRHSIWRDCVIDVLEQRAPGRGISESEIENPPEDVKKIALLEAMRRLHAEQAEHLLTTPNAHGLWLLDDDDIRTDLGRQLGRIAASHHWGHNKLIQELGNIEGVPPALHGLGPFHPVKVACLLRVADACQVDGSRANRFSMSLHRPTGVSEQHWVAQEKLIPPAVETKSHAFIFRSKAPFTSSEVREWWIAHSLLTLAHNELVASNAILEEEKLDTFFVRSVKGATSPLSLSEYVRTEGWAPVDAKVQISDPIAIIELLGGAAFWGTSPDAPIRELIQNAIDAIELRQQIEPHHIGRIVFRLDKPDTNGRWIHIFDNGVGMSERVMSCELIDFGRSLKRSRDLKREYEGLGGRVIRQRGKYGIGLFSILAISRHIKVTSKRFDWGHETCRTLDLQWEGQLRPIILKAAAGQLRGASTCVSFFIKNKAHSIDKALIARLVPCLNCDVLIMEGDKEHVVHNRMWHEQKPYEWLEIRTNHPDGFVTLRDGRGVPIGRATLRSRTDERSGDKLIARHSDSGLLAQTQSPEFKKMFINCMDPRFFAGVLPVETITVTRREYNPAVGFEVLAEWALASLTLLRSAFDPAKDLLLAGSAFYFQVDPIDVALMTNVLENVCDLDQVAAYLCKGEDLLLALDREGRFIANEYVSGIVEELKGDDMSDGNEDPLPAFYAQDIVVNSNLWFSPISDVEAPGCKVSYLSLGNHPFTLFQCLKRKVESQGKTLNISRKYIVVASCNVDWGRRTETMKFSRHVALLQAR